MASVGMGRADVQHLHQGLGGRAHEGAGEEHAERDADEDGERAGYEDQPEVLLQQVDDVVLQQHDLGQQTGGPGPGTHREDGGNEDEPPGALRDVRLDGVRQADGAREPIDARAQRVETTPAACVVGVANVHHVGGDGSPGADLGNGDRIAPHLSGPGRWRPACA